MGISDEDYPCSACHTSHPWATPCPPYINDGGALVKSFAVDQARPPLHRVTIKRWLFLWTWKVERRHFEGGGWGYLTRGRGVALDHAKARAEATQEVVAGTPSGDPSGVFWITRGGPA